MVYDFFVDYAKITHKFVSIKQAFETVYQDLTEVFNINAHAHYGIIDLAAFAEQEGLTVKREIETKGKEYLIGHLIKEPCEIVYDDKGKPFVKDSHLHISVSHSHDRLAIMVNTQEATGIDIELIRTNVVNIKTKFLGQAELEDAGNHVEKLLVYWAAKETLYKIYGLKEVAFIANLFVEPFEYKGEGQLRGHIRLDSFNKRFALQYQELNGYILVYALHELT